MVGRRLLSCGQRYLIAMGNAAMTARSWGCSMTEDQIEPEGVVQEVKNAEGPRVWRFGGQGAGFAVVAV